MLRVIASPTTHISSLARLHVNYCIQMVRPWQLYAALDASTDLRHDLGDTMQDHFMELLRRKYEDCSEWYITNLMDLGIQEPLVIIIMSDGRWQMDEGHHRLAWSLFHNVEEIPVIFDDSGADEDSVMGYTVARANVDAYHYTWQGDVAQVQRAEASHRYSTNEKVFGATAPVVPKKRGGRHRAPEQ